MTTTMMMMGIVMMIPQKGLALAHIFQTVGWLTIFGDVKNVATLRRPK